MKHHIHFGKTPVHRHHVRKFLLYSGACLMVVDAVLSLYIAFNPHSVSVVVERFCTNGGKTGAAGAVLSEFLERAVESGIH